MSADKYPSIFSRQMKAIVYIQPDTTSVTSTTAKSYMIIELVVSVIIPRSIKWFGLQNVY